jgi:hypothetical protein
VMAEWQAARHLPTSMPPEQAAKPEGGTAPEAGTIAPAA